MALDELNMLADEAGGDWPEPGEGPDAEAVDAEGEGGPRHFPRTDLGNAERFAEQHAGRARYCWSTGDWLTWRGTHWTADATGEVFRRATKTTRNIYREAARTKDDAKRAALAGWAKASEARSKLDAMTALARSREGVAIAAADLDRDRWLFNCRNGTIDLRTGELRKHDPADLITRCSPAKYGPDAESPRWHKFLFRIFAGDVELIRFVQRVLGMCLSGDVREQLLFICHGQGANGKSVLLDTVTHLLGDYAGSAAPDLLVAKKHGEHPTELADLQGRRMVVASETESGAPLRLQLVKRLTGDATIKARRMRQDYFEFPRTHKLLLQTNNRPRVNEDTEAVWRRLRLIPFNVVIPLEERDPDLLRKLEAESAGILAWLVRGCLDWQREGLGEPEAVQAATADYRDESDPLNDFLADCCELFANAWTHTADLRQAYERHCERTGAKPLGKHNFSASLKRHGVEPSRTAQSRGWQGVRLLSEASMTVYDGLAG